MATSDELPESVDDEMIQCGDCGEWLGACRCQGRCQVCLEWKDRCSCKGRRKRHGGKKPEWLCFECEEPLDYCQCGVNPYQNLLKAALHIKNPRQRRKALKAIVAIIAKTQGNKVHPGGAGIDFSEPGRPLRGTKRAKGSLPGSSTAGKAVGSKSAPRSPRLPRA